nr:MAG TPA: hypothetical protein [Caudoviricetes sp.]
MISTFNEAPSGVFLLFMVMTVTLPPSLRIL